MGLFDDILKKPATIPMPPADPLAGSASAGQGSSGTGDDGTPPVIVKSDAQVFGTSEELTTPDNPTESTVHAEEDASSVLVGINSVTEPTEATPVPQVSNQEARTQSMETAMTGTGALPVEQTPVAQAVSVEAPKTTTEAVSIEIPQGPSLFDHLMSDTPVVATPEAAPATPEATPVAAEPAPNMFGGTIDDTPVMAAPVESLTPESPLVEAHGDFATPREFIEKSLASIALMLGNIEKRHSTKKEEERGYREEKMRFAELEKNAYIEAEIMDRERDHALRMQSMFQSELDTDTANREKKVHHTEARNEEKHTKKKHEEDTIIAS